MLEQPNLHAVSGDPVDPFDPAHLRVGALAEINVEKVLTAVPVRKPKRTEGSSARDAVSRPPCVSRRLLRWR
jgi:hypothetical protein